MKKDYFHVNEVEPQELVQVLLGHFSQAQGAYKFQRPGTPQFVTVTCDETGNIKSIQLSKGFPEDELEEIERKILNTLLTKQAQKVCQMICFCDAKITGYFRYKDLFQMLPMPDDAGKPRIGMGLIEYPFILEVPYEPCPDPSIEYSRKREKAVIYARLLNLLADQAISIGSRYTQVKWALKTEDPTNITSEPVQLGYVNAGLKEPMDDFSLVDGLGPIEPTGCATRLSH